MHCERKRVNVNVDEKWVKARVEHRQKRIGYLFFGFFSLHRDQPNATHEFFAVVAQLAFVGRAVEASFAAQRNGGLQLAVVHTVVPVGEKGRCGGW